MRSVVVAGKGLWWRRWSSLVILVVAVACAGSAATAATFAVNAGESAFQANVRHAPQDSSGTGVTVSISLDGSIALSNYAAQVNLAFVPLERAGYLTPSIVSESDDKRVVAARPRGLDAPVVYRSASCAHVSIRAGHCVRETDPRGAIITRETAANRGWRVGTPFVIGFPKHLTKLRVVGIYEPVSPSGSYWSAREQQYFGVVGRSRSVETPHMDAVIVPASFWGLPGQSSPVDPPLATMQFSALFGRLRRSNVGPIKSLLTHAYARIDLTFGAGVQVPTVDTQLPAVLDSAQVAGRSISGSMLGIQAQMANLTWLVLFLLLASSTEARTSEVILGKLRGLTPRETWLQATLEPLILVALAVPVGVAGCALVLHLVGNSVLGHYVHPVLPRLAWVAAAWAGLGGVTAVVFTSATMICRSPVGQWRRAERRAGNRGRMLDAVIGAVALAGFVELVQAHASLSATAEFLPGSAPSLLAVGLALAGARLVPLLASAGLTPTRGSSRIAALIAVRRLAGRAVDRRVFVLLTVSVTLVVFGAASRSVLRTYQHDRALTELGASRVITVRAPRGVNTSAAVASIDPSGHLASAVYVGIVSQSGVDPSAATDAAPTLLVVDPRSFSSVAFWRSDFGSSRRLADELLSLGAAPPTLVEVRGAMLRVTATVRAQAVLPIELHAGLTDDSGAVKDIALGAIAPSRARMQAEVVHFAVALPRCDGVCRFRRFSLSSSPRDQTVPRASVVVSSMDEVSASGASRSLLPALLATTWTSPDNATSRGGSVTVATTGGRLSIEFFPQFTPADVDAGYETDSNAASAVPAVVSANLLPPSTLPTFSVQPGQGLGMTIAPTRVNVLPGSGQAGVVISRAWLPTARPDGYDTYQPNQVWLSSSAPADFADRLRAAGVSVLGIRTADAQAIHMARLGAAYPMDMLLFDAIAGAILAAAGFVTSLLVVSRRRLYELAALRALVRPMWASASLIFEQVVIAAVASILGLVAGVVGVRAALGRLPMSIDQPRFPQLVSTVPLGLCTLMALAMFVMIVACTMVGCAGLVLQASPTRMRHVQLGIETRIGETIRVLGHDGSIQLPTAFADAHPPQPRGRYAPHPEDLEVYEVPNPPQQ